ncbi:MAG: hypothetical protein PVJ11_03415, partial [Syntrophobacterales bacterium]
MNVRFFTFMGLVFVLLTHVSPAISEKSRPRTFNKQEIERMKQTTAVLETKFGEITLKFFPEVAPKHVKSFIDLA